MPILSFFNKLGLAYGRGGNWELLIIDGDLGIWPLLGLGFFLLIFIFLGWACSLWPLWP